ncbi:oligosaccharide repeat unit polymerase [Acinetobacter baumannii]|nr:oligosaccharide repeat unit polymerase [Acinetobacter baumannii]MDC5308699.1 oligosaccharide repeat unit polymerase [Acinetobacter baumannii]
MEMVKVNKPIQKIDLVLFLLTVGGVFFTTLALFFSYNTFFLILFGFFWFFSLFIIVLLGNSNPISSAYSLGFFLYFYQVPFIEKIAERSEGVYSLTLTSSALGEYFYLYALILMFNFIVVIFFKYKFRNWNLYFENQNFQRWLSRLIFPSLFVSYIMLIYTIHKIGGFSSFLTLNKFESVQEAKLLFFTWKEFAVLGMAALVFSRSKNLLYYILAVFLVFIELLTAKRLLFLCLTFFGYVVYLRRMSVKIFLLLILAVIFSNLLKYTYYGLKGFFAGENDASSIIWFEWKDFFSDTLLVGEFSAHLRLSYLNIYYGISHGVGNFFEMLGSMLPLASYLDLDYITAGEYLKNYLNEPWSGLASSMYLNPYLSFSLFGILFVYLLYIIIVSFIYSLAKKWNLFKLIFISILPLAFFYIQREELIIVTRNIYVYTPSAILIVFITTCIRAMRKL